jgi:DNA-binding response OmpR family regulator
MPYVMIVDDARDSVEPLARFLERAGYLVTMMTGKRSGRSSGVRRTFCCSTC